MIETVTEEVNCVLVSEHGLELWPYWQGLEVELWLSGHIIVWLPTVRKGATIECFIFPCETATDPNTAV